MDFPSSKYASSRTPRLPAAPKKAFCISGFAKRIFGIWHSSSAVSSVSQSMYFMRAILHSGSKYSSNWVQIAGLRIT